MKLLKELAQTIELNNYMAEASGPSPYEVALPNIMDKNVAGKDLDIYDIFTLANLVWFFSSGRTSTILQMDGGVNLESNATTVAAGDAIRALSVEEIKALCTELLFRIAIGNLTPVGTTMNGMDTAEWMKLVLKKQD